MLHFDTRPCLDEGENDALNIRHEVEFFAVVVLEPLDKRGIVQVQSSVGPGAEFIGIIVQIMENSVPKHDLLNACLMSGFGEDIGDVPPPLVPHVHQAMHHMVGNLQVIDVVFRRAPDDLQAIFNTVGQNRPSTNWVIQA